MSQPRFALCYIESVSRVDYRVEVVIRRRRAADRSSSTATVSILLATSETAELGGGIVPIELSQLDEEDASNLIAGKPIALSWGPEDAYFNVVTKSATHFELEFG